jgi:hypothetical protein
MDGDKYTPLRCCIHVHTYASDGNASIEEICHAASSEGIDCVVITDHETLGHKVNGYVGDVLVITGEEITPDYSIKPDACGMMTGASLNNHLLALGIQQPIRSEDRSPQELIDLICEQGGMSFIAHPAEPGHPWIDWTVERFTGIEIWTYKAAWKRGLEGITSKTYAWRNPDAVINGPAEEGLARWDKLGRSRRIVGIGSSDNHAYRREIEGVERVSFPWEVGLSGIVSYVWVEATRFMEQPVISFLDAVGNGRLIIAHDGLHVARGFQATAHRKAESHIFLPGACIDEAEDLVIEVHSPTPATLCILRDGELIQEISNQDTCDLQIDAPGVWRVEAKLNGRPWVLANPFYVGLWSEQTRVSG